MATLCPDIRQKFFDSNGDPLVGGKIYTYAAGTTTPLATYTDATGGTPNTNPIILDANGEADIWLGTASYKFVIKNSSDVTQKTVDGVIQLADGSVVTAKIADGAVTTAKIADGAITQAKREALNINSSTITIGTVTSTTPATATGSRTIIGTGRPIAVKLVGTDSSGAARFKVSAPNYKPAVGIIEIWRDSTQISSQKFGIERDTAGTPLQTITASGSWTAPFTGLAIFDGCGGGGGGGGTDTSDSGGGGGGAGAEFGPFPLYVTQGQTYTITIGAGGAGGAGSAGGQNGSSGGDTAVTDGTNTLLTWKGGAGGAHGVNGGGAGGAGGSGYFFGGSGGAGGAGGGSPASGTSGSFGKLPRCMAGGAGGVVVSVQSGGGGGGGGSLGLGAHGQNSGGAGAGATSPGYGGGGYGAGGVNSSVRSGGTGGAGVIYIYDGSSLFGATHSTSIPVSAISVEDTGAIAGSHTYTIKTSVTDSSATLTSSGQVALEVYEL